MGIHASHMVHRHFMVFVIGGSFYHIVVTAPKMLVLQVQTVPSTAKLFSSPKHFIRLSFDQKFSFLRIRGGGGSLKEKFLPKSNSAAQKTWVCMCHTLNLGKMNDLPIFRKSGGGRGLKILLVLSWVFLQR